ncbi:MAG TPA: LysR family transcriptional regulator [Dongiaceae bacterium]|nr:LysR family transcriptional regulator [Dongiaceae bacterium]
MNADWDDLRVFLTLTREGSLTAAAKKLDVSHPTIARRVKSLEEAIGARLFDRLPDRFVITPAGEELLADAQAMERAAESIHRRSANLGDTAHGVVRISAGEAMTGYLASNLPRLRDNLNCIEFELTSSHLLANLSRREADLMIREVVPDLASIVTRKLGTAAYAIYGRAGLVPEKMSAARLRELTWIGFDDDHAYMPGQAWIRDLLADGGASDGNGNGRGRPMIRMNNWLVVQQALRAGAGVSLLPCYLGDADRELARIGFERKNVLPPDVSAEQYLLVHNDLRNLPRVRAVMDAIIRLFQQDKALLAGESR